MTQEPVITDIEVNLEQYYAVYEALQCYVRFRPPESRVETDPPAFVVHDRVRFVLVEP